MSFTSPKGKAAAVGLLTLVVIVLSATGLSCGQEKFGGLGLSVAQLYDPAAPGNRGPLIVLYALPGGPAQKAGISGGDIITHMDGDPTEGREFDELIRIRMRGPVGSKATLKIKRARTRETLSISLTRVEISPP
ncbi:MAG: PDZ domain-containing protein [Pseudomonadota bacterium]